MGYFLDDLEKEVRSGYPGGEEAQPLFSWKRFKEYLRWAMCRLLRHDYDLSIYHFDYDFYYCDKCNRKFRRYMS